MASVCTYKRILSLLVGIPFWLVGILISSAKCATLFYIGFSFIRTRTSGFHANGAWKCFFLSLSAEMLFLGILPRLLSKTEISVLLIFSIIIIFKLAPYRCPQMHFSDEEIYACSISAKVRICIIIIGILILQYIHQDEMALGLTLGIVMAATLLAFAYILQREKEYHENAKQENGETH